MKYEIVIILPKEQFVDNEETMRKNRDNIVSTIEDALREQYGEGNFEITVTDVYSS